jgi:hypothetical protein
MGRHDARACVEGFVHLMFGDQNLTFPSTFGIWTLEFRTSCTGGLSRPALRRKYPSAAAKFSYLTSHVISDFQPIRLTPKQQAAIAF